MPSHFFSFARLCHWHWLMIFLFLFPGGESFVLQAQPKSQSQTEILRKELGIPSNEVLARQNEQEFLRMLNLDNLFGLHEIKHKNQIPILLEELSSFSMAQDKEVKLRIRMLMFLLNCMLEGRKAVLFHELVNEAADLQLKNLQVNLILIYAAFSDFSEVRQLIENFWQLREAADILENMPNLIISNKSRIQYYIGDAYYHLGDYVNASKYIHLSLLHYSGSQLIPHLNLMGYLYRLNKQLDSSDLYFQRTLDLAKRNKDSTYIGIAFGNLGINMYQKKQYNSAIPLLETDARIALYQKDYGLASKALLLLSEIYARKGEKEKAGILLGQGRESAIRSGQYKRLKLLYSTSALYYILIGQDEKAIACQDSFQIISDSLAFREASLLRINPELIFQDKKAREEAFRIRTETDKRIQARNRLLFILISGLVVLALILWNFRLRARIRLQGVMQDNQKLELNVVEVKDALNQMADNLAESSRHIAELKESKSEMAGQELRAVEKITDTQWAEFRALFDQAHPGFVSRIKVKIPNLTPSEIRYMMLVRMHVKDGRMAEMLCVGQEAIRKTRSRLKQKIAFSEGETLEDFILSV